MLDEIDKLKERLDELMSEEEKDPNKILKISQELDILIVEYYRQLGIDML